MKRYDLLFFFAVLLPFFGWAQDDTWAVKAFTKGGDALPVNVYLEDGTVIPVFSIYAEGNNHFMDVKGVHNDTKISIKLVQSNDILIPVKAISETGEILKVKAVDTNGDILDVKGVSRDGNTINVAAVKGDNNYLPLKAVSPTGVSRDVKGVKFVGEMVEMELSGVKVVAHLKAIPTIDAGEIEKQWGIRAFDTDDNAMNVIAINKKGREYPINAAMAGKNPYLMHIKGEASYDIHIKITKQDDGLAVSGIDEYGRPYDIKAKTADGTMYDVVCGEKMGNVIPIYVKADIGNMFPVKAVSSADHRFDVKGIKVLKKDIEGLIHGVNGYVKFYAHVKALAPASSK